MKKCALVNHKEARKEPRNAARRFHAFTHKKHEQTQTKTPRTALTKRQYGEFNQSLQHGSSRFKHRQKVGYRKQTAYCTTAPRLALVTMRA